MALVIEEIDATVESEPAGTAPANADSPASASSKRSPLESLRGHLGRLAQRESRLQAD